MIHYTTAQIRQRGQVLWSDCASIEIYLTMIA